MIFSMFNVRLPSLFIKAPPYGLLIIPPLIDGLLITLFFPSIVVVVGKLCGSALIVLGSNSPRAMSEPIALVTNILSAPSRLLISKPDVVAFISYIVHCTFRLVGTTQGLMNATFARARSVRSARLSG